MDKGIHDRRQDPRLPACLMVRYTSDSLEFTAVATNVSLHGVFVESDILDMKGTRATLQLFDGTMVQLLASGEVVWVVSETMGIPGMGIRFIELTRVANAWIERYCQDYATSLRVLVANRDKSALGRVVDVVHRAGAKPLCLSQDLLSLEAIERLQPHVVMLGLGQERTSEIVERLENRVVPSVRSVLVGASSKEDSKPENWADERAAKYIAWDDEQALLASIAHARASAPGSPVTSGPGWLN